jgi:hypothetical protein
VLAGGTESGWDIAARPVRNAFPNLVLQYSKEIDPATVAWSDAGCDAYSTGRVVWW